jgi:hypothetical protein
MRTMSTLDGGGVTKDYTSNTAARGHVQVVNHWDENGGLMEGARLGYVLKKGPAEVYRRHPQDGTLVYNLTHKPADGGRDGAGMTRPVPYRQENDPKYADVLLCPYQLFPVCISDGGPCPREWLSYYDELKRFRTDGIFLELGRVHADPALMRFHRAVESEEQRPIMDGRNHLESFYRVHVILNVDDGLRCV